MSRQSAASTSPSPGTIWIKLCGVRTVRDAQLCAEAGADEIGVVFAKKSRRCVSIEEAREIRESLPPAPGLVGVFQDASLAEVEAAVEAARLSAVQLHGSLPADLFSGRISIPIYRALQIEAADSLAALRSLAPFSRLLLDGPRGGSGASFSWPLTRSAREFFRGPLFVAGGLTPENVADAIAQGEPDGVDVSSGIEGPDGFKDPGRVRAFVEAARKAARGLARGVTKIL